MAVRLKAFTQQLESSSTAEAATALLQTAVDELGFCAWAYLAGRTRVPRPKSASDLDIACQFVSDGWPDDAAAQALSRLGAADLAGVVPFAYAMPPIDASAPSAPTRQVKPGRPGGAIRTTLAIPLHLPPRRFGLLTLGSRLEGRAFARLDRETRPAAALLGGIFHDFVSQRICPDIGPSLSDRETECLHWAGQGKTNSETAEILAISARTVKKHINSAMRKLEATTRTQGVARAAARGLIAS